MATATRLEALAGRQLSLEEPFDIAQVRETRLSRLLMIYITTGLLFMLLPGTFLGVWNLIAISKHHAATFVSAGWMQAHGHAQIFGWIGTFVLGIGFYSIPKLRRMDRFALWTAWTSWGMWTLGVSLRWLAGSYQWHWRQLLPFSALLELVAFLMFFLNVSGHRSEGTRPKCLEPWVVVVIAATLGLLATLLVNLGITIYLAVRGISPDLPQNLDQRFLILQSWGFLVPFVWGFSAKWLPIFLGLRPLHARLLLAAVAWNCAGVVTASAGRVEWGVRFLALGITFAIWALRLLEPGEHSAKTKGVHSSFPFFIRLSYAWAGIAATLSLWAAATTNSHGVWGASRHALTVGFLATMVFCIGQRVLPAFSGMRLLFSTKLMFVSLLLLNSGCALRVSSEILAYQGFADGAWTWLPISAVTEMSAVTLFAANLFLTFVSRPPSECRVSRGREITTT
jgi:hypothetical protein